MRGKRGQVFLIAAVIVIGVMFGLASVSTYAIVSDDKEQFYDLSQEVELETKRVIDYGVYQEVSEEDRDSLISGFLAQYSNYIREDLVIFIFGNEDNLNELRFYGQNLGGIGVNIGEGTPINQQVDGQTFEVGQINVTQEGIIEIEIEGVNYEFELRDGENFFFVIVKEEDGEKFVAAR